MKLILKTEKTIMPLSGIYAFNLISYPWWLFLVLFFTTDIGMIGYFKKSKVGVFLYNLFCHRAISILVFLVGIYFRNEVLQFLGIIVFSHIAFDRMLGYGLKYPQGFKFTHLGAIGNEN